MRKKKRRFRYLLHKHLIRLHAKSEISIKKEINFLEKQSNLSFYMEGLLTTYKECVEFYKLGREFELSDEILELIISKYYISHQLDVQYLRKHDKPIKEGRDNKSVHVGSGGSNRNKVRYPKKNRNRRTWANFYKLFPKLAEQDGWNGKTSKRMG